MRFTKPIALGLALALAAASFTGTAEARHRHHVPRWRCVRRRNFRTGRRGDDRRGLVAAAIRLLPGARLCGAARRPSFIGSAPVYYEPPEPWTPAWYDYCNDRYRSFNPRTGYFFGFDGELPLLLLTPEFSVDAGRPCAGPFFWRCDEPGIWQPRSQQKDVSGGYLPRTSCVRITSGTAHRNYGIIWNREVLSSSFD